MFTPPPPKAVPVKHLLSSIKQCLRNMCSASQFLAEGSFLSFWLEAHVTFVIPSKQCLVRNNVIPKQAVLVNTCSCVQLQKLQKSRPKAHIPNVAPGVVNPGASQAGVKVMCYYKPAYANLFRSMGKFKVILFFPVVQAQVPLLLQPAVRIRSSRRKPYS